MTHASHRRAHRLAVGRDRVAAGALLALAAALTLACGGGRDAQAASDDQTADTPVTTRSEGVSTPESGPVTMTPREVSFETAEEAYRAGRYPEAVELFTVYSGTHPKNPWGHYMLGLSSWKAGLLDDAERALGQALSLDPGHVKSLLNLTRVRLEAERPRDALESVEEALALDSTLGEAYRLLGRTRFELGEVESAVEAYHRALALDAQDVWSMNNLGHILIQQGRFEEALPPLARAIELRPEVAAFQNNLGIALERTGRFVAAAGAYRAALSADSGHVKAEVNLARVDGRENDPQVGPVDLTMLALRFEEEIARWRETLALTPGPVARDSVVPVVVKREQRDSIPKDR